MSEDVKVHVVIDGHNDGLRYTAAAAVREVKNLLRGRPHLDGCIEVVPAA